MILLGLRFNDQQKRKMTLYYMLSDLMHIQCYSGSSLVPTARAAGEAPAAAPASAGGPAHSHCNLLKNIYRHET